MSMYVFLLFVEWKRMDRCKNMNSQRLKHYIFTQAGIKRYFALYAIIFI